MGFVHIQHPALQPDVVEFRGYQANLARIASAEDTLVVLPTGMGKTVVAVLVLADALRDGATRILVLAPTKPLVEQHAAFLRKVLAAPWNDQVHVLTGHSSPAKRDGLYGEDGILCATPQVIHNDVIRGALKLASVDLTVFDECHRAAGDYPYVFLGQELLRVHPSARRMGLTASPGHDLDKIQEVRANLGLGHVEIRTPTDRDVKEFVQDVAMDWETLPMPKNMARVSERLRKALKERLKVLKDLGVLASISDRQASRKNLLEAGRRLQVHTKRADVPPEIYHGLSVQAQAMKLLHAIELAETQGAAPFRAFFEKMRDEAKQSKPSKATLRLLDDDLVNEAYHIARYDESENPKLGRTTTLVQEQLRKNPDSRILLFANYRSTGESIASTLESIDGVRPVVFVGQGKRGGSKGLTQKQQQETVQAFRDGTHNVLVATSVAEEGLDIPQTDLVVFYEPIPSEIRAIQRRGRTGRQREGRVVVLMTKGTQDEAAHWVARRKEQEMVDSLQTLRRTLSRRSPLPAGPQQRTLDAVVEHHDEAPLHVRSPSGPAIIVDHRERAGGVLAHLHAMDAHLDLQTLDVGDFVLSSRVCVERKRCDDFVHSVMDGRLFEQLATLQESYAKPLLVLEGESLWGHANMRPEAIMGAMASVTVDYGIPVMQTRDAEETARFLVAVARREQHMAGGSASRRGASRTMSDDERLEHILAGFPDVDRVRAQAFLDRFGSLKAIFDATEAELATAEGIGPKTAANIHRLLLLERVAQTL